MLKAAAVPMRGGCLFLPRAPLPPEWICHGPRAMAGSSEASIMKDPRQLRLEKLIQASQSLASIETLDLLLPKLLEMAEDVTGAEASSYLEYHPETEELRFLITREPGQGQGELLKEQVVLKMGEGIAGAACKDGVSILVREVGKDSRFSRKADQATGFSTTSILCAPVRYQDQLLGAIEVVNSKHKPFFDDGDKDVLESFASLAAVSIIRARMLAERLEQEELRIQVAAAARIQASFFPDIPALEHGHHAQGFSQPAKMVGGDLYDCIPMPGNGYLFFVADVTGKGLPAALVMSALWAEVRSKAFAEPGVAPLLERVNQELYAFLSGQAYFITIFLCRYWPETGRVQLANCGHPPPIWKTGNGFREVPPTKNLPLGIIPQAEYSQAEITLEPGQSLLIYSDGIHEAFDLNRDMYGTERIFRHVESRPGPPWGQSLLAEVEEWQAGCVQGDDITILEIWRE